MTNYKMVSELNFDNIDTQSISNNLKFLSESFRFLSFNLQKYKNFTYIRHYVMTYKK